MQGPRHLASALATVSSDSVLSLGVSPSPLCAAFPMPAHVPARQSPLAHGTKWDRSPRHHGAGRAGCAGRRLEAATGSVQPAVRGGFLPRELVGRDACCRSTRSQGGIPFQWRWERRHVRPCIARHLIQRSAALGHRRDAWPPRTTQAPACVPKSLLPLHLSFPHHRTPLSLPRAGGQHPADTSLGSRGCRGPGLAQAPQGCPEPGAAQGERAAEPGDAV